MKNSAPVSSTLCLAVALASAAANATGDAFFSRYRHVEEQFSGGKATGTTERILEIARVDQFLRIGLVQENAPAGPNIPTTRPNARDDWFFEHGDFMGFFNEGLFYEDDPGFQPPANLAVLWAAEGLVLTRDRKTGGPVTRSLFEYPSGATFTVGGPEELVREYVLQPAETFSHGMWRMLHRQVLAEDGTSLSLSETVREVTMTTGAVYRFPLTRTRVLSWHGSIPATVSVTTWVDPLAETGWLESPAEFVTLAESEDPEVLHSRTQLELLSHAPEVEESLASIEGFLDRIVAVRAKPDGRIVYLETPHRPKGTHEVATFDRATRSFVTDKKD